MEDVNAMLRLGLVERPRVMEYFSKIEPLLFRYPAIDPPSFRRAVEAAIQAEVA